MDRTGGQVVGIGGRGTGVQVDGTGGQGTGDRRTRQVDWGLRTSDTPSTWAVGPCHTARVGDYIV